MTNAWHLFGFCHYNPRILNLHQPDNESRAEDMKHCLQREEGTGIPWNAQCGYGVLLFLFTTSQAEHKQLGFPWRVDLEVWTEVAEGMTLGMPLSLSLSQVPFKPAFPKVQGAIPWPAPHHIPGDQRRIWNLPLISFPITVIHCPVPRLGANLCPSMRNCS